MTIANDADFSIVNHNIDQLAAAENSAKHSLDFQQWFSNFWQQSDDITRSVMVILLIMSLISWMQILLKTWRSIARSKIHKTLQSFWLEATIEKAILLITKKLGRNHIFTALARNAVTAAHYFDHQKRIGISRDIGRQEFIANTLRQSVNYGNAQLESGMTFLASIGAIAPFVGLFGTVYGIYHALTQIAHEGLMNIGSVSGPVGEALIMTAVGLFVAIPAVFAYNCFSRSNRLELLELEGFANDLHSYLNIGTKVSVGAKIANNSRLKNSKK